MSRGVRPVRIDISDDEQALLDRVMQQLWLDQGLAQHSLNAYETDLRVFAAWLALHKKALLRAHRADILTYLAEKMGEGKQARSLARMLSAARRFYGWLLAQGEIMFDPTLDIPPPSIGRPLPKSLSEDDVVRLITAPPLDTSLGLRDRAMLETLYATGLRVSELIKLNLGQMSLTSGVVRVLGKGRKERCTPLSKNTRAVLAAWAREPPLAKGQPLFPNARGGKLSPHGVHYLLSKHVKTAAVKCPSLNGKRVSPHVLRHTTAMDLLQEGVEQSTIALWLGHESIETTQIYLDADLAMKQAVLDKTTPPEGKPGRYRPDDSLLAFLKGL